MLTVETELKKKKKKPHKAASEEWECWLDEEITSRIDFFLHPLQNSPISTHGNGTET